MLGEYLLFGLLLQVLQHRLVHFHYFQSYFGSFRRPSIGTGIAFLLASTSNLWESVCFSYCAIRILRARSSLKVQYLNKNRWILTGKVALWGFFSSATSEKIHNSTFQVKISVKNVIFSNEMEKKPRYSTYLIFHRIWKKYFYSNSFLRNTLMIDMIGGQPTG